MNLFFGTSVPPSMIAKAEPAETSKNPQAAMIPLLLEMPLLNSQSIGASFSWSVLRVDIISYIMYEVPKILSFQGKNMYSIDLLGSSCRGRTELRD
jgi:hypothetical protein